MAKRTKPGFSGTLCPPRISPAASEEINTLLLAENWIGTKSDKRKAGVETIAALLRTHQPGSDWSRAHYGALAVKASLADGDLEKAKAILDLALPSDPQDPQLRYLSRLIARAEGVQPTEGSNARFSATWALPMQK